MTTPELLPSGFRPAIVAPTFDNDRTLADLLRQLETLQLPIIVVNDGSTDTTSTILSAWRNDERQVVTHEFNRGKAAALRSGFEACRLAGLTHAISIDTDGQHAAGDVPRLLAAAQANPQALVVGTRDERSPDYPFKSRWGRRFANALVKLECGHRVEDSQCGLRVYPLYEIASLTCAAGRFGFETEVITRACWAGIAVVGVSVECRYLPIGQRVSHYKPWRDTIRGLGMHARLLAIALFKPRSTTPFSLHLIRSQIRQTIRSINPVTAWRTLRDDAVGRGDFAVGFAVGVFIANLPLYGVQTVVGLFTARRLHLHPLSVLAGTHVSTPPIGPLLIAGAIVVGHFVLHGNVPSWIAIHSQWHGHVAGLVTGMLADWIIGGVCVGLVTAGASYFIVRAVLHLTFVKRSISADRWSPATGSAE